DELAPSRPRVGIAAQIPGHGPWPGQRMVVDRDLVVQDVLVGLVEIDALLEDRLVVVMQRQARGIVMARSLETSGLDFQHVVAAVAVLVDPSADGIASERRLYLLRPIASVGIDAAVVLDPIDEDVGGLRRDDEFLRLDTRGAQWTAQGEYS